ncbi:MAG TPA: preprotein translocase subunit YajC [Candidatus Binatus sp.]|uniref:preprotein translocase subunit YajC n=1 Tax=Candidatus Binatus sp. TaxID=2811406 RepID=UPI002B48A61D|nr:preprotein translocase subunit YajC [Candidatus Binatus sp.]HKN14016.1 preprotein translocase subunit YajC [Candidatus Binatus sp.]
MLFEGTAWAQAASANPAEAPSFVQQLLTGPGPIMALVVAVMYFLVFRPQSKKAQEQAKMLSALKRNDEVVTTGGIIGRIQEVGDKVITLEVAPNVRLRVERSQIASMSSYKASAKKDDK